MATKPSLALIPSGYKASKVYSVLPSNGDGDFTFTRSGTATRVNAQGLIEIVDANTPRLNYPLIDGEVSGCPSLLLEPSRQNKLLYSEDFNNSYWLHSTDITVTDSTELAPNGQLDANLIEFDGSNYSYIRRNITVPSNGTTLSVFAKKGNWRYLGFRQFQSTGVHTVFDFDTETFPNVASGQSASFEAYPNGWYRIEVKHPSPESNVFIGFALTNSSGSELNPTGGQVANVHLFGAQVEEGSYSTSYIPTSETAITRSAETANGAGDAATFNDSEGVLYVEISALDDDETFRILALSNNTATDHIRIYYTNNSNAISILVRSGGINQYTFLNYNVNNITEYTRIAVKYKDSDFATFLNGFKINSKTDGGISPVGLDRLNFDNGGGGYDFYGNTKQLMTFNEALSDTELENLTSWDSFSEMATAQLYTIQ